MDISTLSRFKKYSNDIEFFAWERPDSINLSSIKVKNKKQRLGIAFMKELVDYADSKRKIVVLSPSTDFGATSVGRLKKFYKRFGFIENKGRNKDYAINETMYRKVQGALKMNRKEYYQIIGCLFEAGEYDLAKVVSGLSPVLYHATTYIKAYNIIKGNKFRLSTYLGSSSDNPGNMKGLYYLSTSRIKYGGYSRYLSDQQATFVLDGRKLSQRYKGRSIHYWGDMARVENVLDKITDEDQFLKNVENEDTLYSHHPFIKPATNYIKELHILVPEKEYLKKALELYRVAKNKKIPVYVYDNKNNYITQNKHKALDVKNVIKSGALNPPRSSRRFTKGNRAPDHAKLLMSSVIKATEAYKHLYDTPNKIPSDIDRYLSLLQMDFHAKDIGTSIMNHLHNAKNKGGYTVKIVNDFTKILKKLHISSVNNYLNWLSSERDKYLKDYFKKLKLNKMKSMGLRPGDAVVDKRGNIGHVHLDEEGTPYVNDHRFNTQNLLDDWYGWKRIKEKVAV